MTMTTASIESNTERLYTHLPAIYRVRDAAEGEPLRALLAVIEAELAALEGDVDRLYDNWFIETCEEWVVPYIGDLLGVRGLLSVETQDGTEGFSQRARVANTLGYRRRKGTAAMLEQLARDVTGWPARVVEFFELLATTQHVNHVRPTRGGTLNLRDTDHLELLGGPFERAAHTAEVRHIDNRRGRYNIPNLGIFLWRLQSYALSRVSAQPASALPPGCYRFDPLGRDIPLFNLPRTETGASQLADEPNVPGPLRRRPLYDELESARQAVADGGTPSFVYFGVDPVLEVHVQMAPDGPFELIPPQEMLVCNLSDPLPPEPPLTDWRRPPSSIDYVSADDGTTQALPIRVSVDPITGRLVFPTGIVPNAVEISYAYGFSGDLGGGPYDRRQSLQQALPLPNEVDWQIGVTRDQATLARNAAAGRNEIVATFAEAVQAWNARPAGTRGVIALMDSRTYVENLTGSDAIVVPNGSRLFVVAADWPEEEPRGFDPFPPPRQLGRLTPSLRRPLLLGRFDVGGGAEGINPGELTIDGLVIGGILTVQPGNLGLLRLAHATLVPDMGGLTLAPPSPTDLRNERLTVVLERCVTGPLTLDVPIQSLRLQDCIVAQDGEEESGPAIGAPTTDVDVQASTVRGEVEVRTLHAGNSVFVNRVMVARRQKGCVRFCYLPLDSLAPRRYRCQPEDETSARRVVPQFRSLRYGSPAYAQLDLSCPTAISEGVEDEEQMGAFRFLRHTQRTRALRGGLEEYLRFGLESGFYFVT